MTSLQKWAIKFVFILNQISDTKTLMFLIRFGLWMRSVMGLDYFFHPDLWEFSFRGIFYSSYNSAFKSGFQIDLIRFQSSLRKIQLRVKIRTKNQFEIRIKKRVCDVSGTMSRKSGFKRYSKPLTYLNHSRIWGYPPHHGTCFNWCLVKSDDFAQITLWGISHDSYTIR